MGTLGLWRALTPKIAISVLLPQNRLFRLFRDDFLTPFDLKANSYSEFEVSSNKNSSAALGNIFHGRIFAFSKLLR